MDQLNQKRIKYNWHEADVSIIEGVLARGDRRLSEVILKVYQKGCFYDAWSEMTDDMGEKSHFSGEFWHTVFIQACSGVLTDAADFSDLVKNVPEYFNEKFKKTQGRMCYHISKEMEALI